MHSIVTPPRKMKLVYELDACTQGGMRRQSGQNMLNLKVALELENFIANSKYVWQT